MEIITVGLVVLRGDLLSCFFFFNAACAGTYIYQKLAHLFNVLCSRYLGWRGCCRVAVLFPVKLVFGVLNSTPSFVITVATVTIYGRPTMTIEQ